MPGHPRGHVKFVRRVQHSPPYSTHVCACLWVQSSPCEVLESRTAWAGIDLLSVSVQQQRDNSRSPRLPRCLEAALASGWFGMDSSHGGRPAVCFLRLRAPQNNEASYQCF